MAKKAVFKVPKTLGACADRLYELKDEIGELNKQVAVLETEQSAIKTHLIEHLPKSEATGVAGNLARATIKVEPVPQAKDWDLIRAYIVKTKSWDLLQKRLSNGAVGLRWDEGKLIPGIEAFNVVKVSITKV